MARATVSQVKSIVEEIQAELEKLTTIVKGDPEKNVVGLVTEIKLLKQRNQFEDRLANIAVGIGSALLVFLLTNGCSQLVSATAAADFPAASPAPTETDIPGPTGTPTQTATATSTATPTPSIYEVTPLPVSPSAADYWVPLPSGTRFTPINNLYVRDCTGHEPATNDKTNPKILDAEGYPLKVYAGQRVEVYTVYKVWGSPDRWLCIDPPLVLVDKMYMCPRAIAYILGGLPYGELTIDD